MNMSDLLKQYFAPAPMQAQPPATDDGTDDWSEWQKRLAAARGGMTTADLPARAAGWPATPDAKLPAYSPTTGSGQSGTAY